MRTLPSLLAIAFGSCMLSSTRPSALAGEDVKFQSRTGQHVSLVELFTSEGCSSCPPAEAWLSQLVASPQLWTQVVPVAYHVDYWDNLGWRDRFSSAQWTAREGAYAAKWGGNSMYTPCLANDGREWRQWASTAGGAAAANVNSHGGTGRLSVVVKEGKHVSVTYHAEVEPSAARTATVALLGCNLTSKVNAGENSGRNLRHDFVALSFQTKLLAIGNAEGTASFDLPSPPEDARRLAVAVWVEKSGQAEIEQATGGWLSAD